MKIEVLVAAMHQKNHSLIEKMNIQSDVVVGNQCDFNSVEEFEWNTHQIKYLNFAERGVGLNRNNSLMRADGDILVFADDDEVFNDGYADVIKKAYKEIPDADAIIFNISTIGTDVGRKNIKKIKRIKLLNALNYGAVRLSVKNIAVKKHNLTFSRLFGGGAIYSSGEDSLFIADLLKNKLKVYVYPAVIATVDQTSSTWFEGYTEKYFYDKGALFAAFSPKLGKILCRLMLWKNRKLFFSNNLTYRQGIEFAKLGAKGFNSLLTYEEWKAINANEVC